MASSLEELLAEEGFRGRRSGMRSRASFRADAALKSLHPSQDKSKKDSPSSHRVKTERTRSDLSRYILRGELPSSDSHSSRRPRDYLVSRENAGAERLITDSSERHHLSRLSNDFLNIKRNNDLPDSKESEITEIGEEADTRVKDLYSEKAYNSERRGRSSPGNGQKQRYLDRKGDIRKVSKKNYSSYDKNMINYTSSMDRKKKMLGRPDPSYETSVRSSINFEGDEGQKLKNVSPELPKLALDEVAVKATVSILNGYIKRFLKDDEFLMKLRQDCFSSLGLNEDGETSDGKSKVMTNLEQAIETVEKAAAELSSPKELKTASMHLSMITSLKSNDMQEGSTTSGILNSRLSACAHLYLSVAHKLQKKDKVSAKYLLQVFCDSPFLARARLLPELWDYLFFPHLSHLEEWYNQEADSLLYSPNRIRKLELLDKVYNEILDSGTYQVALYYKDWLTVGIEAPSLPSVHIPTMSFQEVQLENSKDRSSGLSLPSDSFSPRPMVSKKLYETVFGHSISQEINQVEENIDNGAIHDGSSVEVAKTLTYSSEIVKCVNKDIEKICREDTQENTFPSDYESSASKEEWKLVKVSSPPEMDIKYDFSNFKGHQEPAGNFHLLNAFSYTKSNELILMNLAESIFEAHQTEDSGDLTIRVVSQTSKLQPIKVTDPYELAEVDGKYKYFDEGTFIASAPEDFICPLSGQLFEDPVTLETGQTFEREAIKDWFEQGYQTCPVTGKILKCQTVPFTNFILKRVIDSWKLEHCSHLMALATKIVGNSGKNESRERDEKAIYIFELLLTTFSMEQRLANAKHLLSLGGLEFLVRRFTRGNLEVKTRVAALLLCCIEGDASCRSRITKNIESHCLLELLQSKKPKSRTNAVLLLIQLLCLCSMKDVKLFLSGLQNEEIMSAKHILLIYLQITPPEQMPWIAALLLHLDLLVEPQRYSIYREEAVDAIAKALNQSLTDEKVQESSCRVLLTLGGRFSASGKLITEYWILKEAGTRSKNEAKSQEDDSLSLEDEEDTINEWLRNLSASLLNDGKRSFLDAISKCLDSGNSDLVKASLVTVAWLSCALTSLFDAEMHLSASSDLISGLKESLENSEQIVHKVLASMSLLNFTKIPECRVLLMTIAEEIAVPLRSLVEVTWIAKQLYQIISREYS